MSRQTPTSLEATGPSPDPAGDHYERRVRSFQPRRGRVTAAQRSALERLWPRWGVEVDGQRPLDLTALFAETGGEPAKTAETAEPTAPGEPAAPEASGHPGGGRGTPTEAGARGGPAHAHAGARPVVLEVGFGMGEATVRMAADDPETSLLAVDVHTPGQGNLLRLAEREGLTNVRVANGDALILLRRMLAPGSLDGLRVYFPDPWPKKRHHKRRLVQPEFLDAASPALRSGGLVHMATDWSDYAEQILDELTAHPEYENTQPGGGFAPRPSFRPLTRFEGQGLDKGHDVFDVLFRRR